MSGDNSEDFRQIPACDGLDAIAAESAKWEAENAAPPVGADGLPVTDQVRADTSGEWREAVRMGCGMVLAVKPELQADWTPGKMDALGDALDRCAVRYGWTVGELLGHPLLGLAFAAWGLAAPLVRIERAKSKLAQAAPMPSEPVPA